MPSALSIEESIALQALMDLLRNPQKFGCRFECPESQGDESDAAHIITDAGAIIDDLRPRRRRFPSS